MTIALWLMGVLLVGAAGAIGWLVWERGRQIARACGLEAELAAARQDREAGARRVAELESQVGEVSGGLEAARIQLATRERDLSAAREQAAREVQHLGAQHAKQLEHAEAVHRERLGAVQRERDAIQKALSEFESRMRESFGTLAGETLQKTTGEFLKLAETKLAAKSGEATAEMDKRREAVERMVNPIIDTLKRTDEKLTALEKDRVASSAQLLEQVRQVSQAGSELRGETAKLVKALREPNVRGRYGEIQLKRVAELAGMRAYCDFCEQESVVNEDGTFKRPDMVVKLPNGRELVVDAKANLKPYLDALEASTPEEAEGHLHRFADGLVKQAGLLSKKSYYRDYDGSPDFVVMFVPGDQFVDAALAKRPELMEMAAGERVLIASPSTLIAMLRAVAVGFAEQKITEEAKQIKELAVELHGRAAVLLDHMAKLGRGIESVVERFNDATGSFQSRLMPTLRRIEGTGVSSGKELEEGAEVTVRPRLIGTEFEKEPMLRA